MDKISLSCKKATSLIEKKNLFPLTGKEKMQLWMHNSMCGACRAYQKQSKTLDKMVSLWYSTRSKDKNNDQLSDQVKEALLNKIEDK
ncbi:MAG: hypothetical protein WD426_04425 [Anditalea sp.]